MTIFYLKEKFELLDSGKFGLSETPEKLGLIGWDAKNPRLALWVKLLQKHQNKHFVVINTHLDHIGENARQNGEVLLVNKIREIAGNFPILLCGDFNSNTDSQTYRTIIENGFIDCSNNPVVINYDQPYTYHRYILGSKQEDIDKFKDDKRVLKIIDHIFYNGSIKVLRHGILADNYAGIYPSDHFPKLCDVILEDY